MQMIVDMFMVIIILFLETLEMAKLAEQIIIKREDPDKSMDESSFFICKSLYGKYNWGDAFDISMKYIYAGITNTYPGALRARSYYPEKGGDRPNAANLNTDQIDGLEAAAAFNLVGTNWLDIVDRLDMITAIPK